MNEAAAFEFYVRRIWPVQRLWARRQIARRCERCIVSERFAPLNANGLCATCAATAPRESRPHHSESLVQLDRLLESAQGQGIGRYDALVLYSGGKDSVYLTHRLRKRFPGLRLLALTVDNGFMSPYAVENVRRTVPRLEVDHLFYRPRQGFMKQLFRYTLTHLNELGCYGTVDFSDGEHLLDAARTVAATQNIPIILCGYSRYQVEDGLQLNHWEYPQALQQQDRTHVAGIALTDIFSGPDLDYWWMGSRWPAERIPKLLFPLYAWDLPEDDIRASVLRDGLIEPGSDSPVLTNHLLIPLLGVVDVQRSGYASFEPEFSRMVRDGRADAKVWRPIFEFLEYSSRTGLFVKPMADRGLAMLGLSRADVGIAFR